jgi:hypothetical protein
MCYAYSTLFGYVGTPLKAAKFTRHLCSMNWTTFAVLPPTLLHFERLGFLPCCLFFTILFVVAIGIMIPLLDNLRVLAMLRLTGRVVTHVTASCGSHGTPIASFILLIFASTDSPRS